MTDREALQWELEAAFSRADYPVESPLDLATSLPDGPSTRFEAGEFSMTAMELTTALGAGDFPYEDHHALVEDVLADLEDHGYL